MITIYGRNNCVHCLKVKQLCQSFNLDYEYKNIDEDQDARTEFMEMFPAILHVPITIWNDDVFQGYNAFAEALENNIQNYGEGKI